MTKQPTNEAEASCALDHDPECETVVLDESEAEADIGAGRISPVHAGAAATIAALKLARERKLPYPEAVVDAEVLEQGLMVKAVDGQGADEVPTALEAAERRIGEGRAGPQPELAPRLRVGAQVANLWDTGSRRFEPVARRKH